MPRSPVQFLALCIILAGSPLPADAVEFDLEGYVDFRLIRPASQRSWLKGGLGKLRFGDGNDQNISARLGEIVLQGHAQVTSALSAVVSGRIEQQQRTAGDILEGYLRYRPVSVGPLRWSLKAGAFFPPLSLENDEIGWTSPWTLTPSAINSWVGEEIRIVGSEAAVEWRRPTGRTFIHAGIYGWNDPAGILIAGRGWALNDRPTGLIDRVRLSDATALRRGQPIPFKSKMFKEIDDRPGWYVAMSWQEDSIGKFQLIRYDNRGDPSAFRELFAWRTKFWNAGIETYIGKIRILGQALTGETIIAPSPTFRSTTRFRSAFLMTAWELEHWRFAVRGELFDTEQKTSSSAPFPKERGHAVTLATSWIPKDWLRLTGELLHVSSRRSVQALSLGPLERGNQLQLSVRFYY